MLVLLTYLIKFNIRLVLNLVGCCLIWGWGCLCWTAGWCIGWWVSIVRLFCRIRSRCWRMSWFDCKVSVSYESWSFTTIWTAIASSPNTSAWPTCTSFTSNLTLLISKTPVPFSLRTSLANFSISFLWWITRFIYFVLLSLFDDYVLN